MQLERFRKILDAFGSREDAWPAEERSAMLQFLERDHQAKELLAEARELDLLLDSYQPKLPDLSARILDAVPESMLDRFLRWLMPGDLTAWWQPALASSLPLIVGLAIGVTQPDEEQLALQQYDWELQERHILAQSADLIEGSWYE